jgi:hypothetical protein
VSRDFLTHPFLYMITTPFFNEILPKQAQKKAFQYFVAPPLFLRHASHLLGTESQSFKRKFPSISGHIIVNANRISCTFLTLCLLLEIKSLMCFQRFSIGLRSGDCSSHFILLTFLLVKYLVIIFAVCQGALSSYITTSSPYFLLISL